MLRSALVAAIGAFCAPAALAQLTLTELTVVDLDSTANALNPEFIGSNPSAVAWDGTDLYVAGFNNSNAAQNVGIVRVTDALGAQTLGAAFGALNTPSFRGYSGLDVAGGSVFAAYDPGGVDPNGIASYSPLGAQNWAKSARGGSGVGVDPGFNSGVGGQGVGWTTFGSGRRALQNSANGADIFTTANGMIILAGSGTFWRDMEFDDATGDVWLRKSNKIIRATRNGDNSIASATVVVDAPNADFVAQQNIAFAALPADDVLFYNDRSNTGAGQDFFTIVKAARADGSALSIDWGAFAPAGGNGAYDFSWDAGSGTLALLDFQNRNCHIFSVTLDPYFSYGTGCIGSGSFFPTLTASGDATGGGGPFQLTVADALGGSNAVFLFGIGDGVTPIGFGCDLLVNAAPLVALPPLPLGGIGAGQGTISIGGSIPASASGLGFNCQVLCADGGVAAGFSATNGVRVDVP